MSDQPSQPGSATELDARVDELIGQVAATTGPAEIGVVVGPTTEIVSTPIPDPPEGSNLGKMVGEAGAGPDPAPAEALLTEISEEIERQAPGALPTPPEPPTPPVPAPVSIQPTPAEIAAAAREVEADLTAFEPPAPNEAAPLVAAAPAPPATPAPLAQPTSEPISEAPRPGAEIKKLDAALAAGAERALAEAQREMSAKEPTKEPAPAAPAAPRAEPAPEAAKAAAPEPAPKSVPAPAAKPAELAPTPAPELAEPKPAKRAMLVDLLAPLRPIAAIHEKLGEPARQTIAYCSIITIFFATCVWGRVLVFPPKAQLEPKTEAAEFYNDTTPAHGVAAPARKPVEAAGEHGSSEHGSGEHGSSEEGHAEAKKDEHAKPKPEEKSSSHGGGSHGSESSSAKEH